MDFHAWTFTNGVPVLKKREERMSEIAKEKFGPYWTGRFSDITEGQKLLVDYVFQLEKLRYTMVLGTDYHLLAKYHTLNENGWKVPTYTPKELEKILDKYDLGIKKTEDMTKSPPGTLVPRFRCSAALCCPNRWVPSPMTACQGCLKEVDEMLHGRPYPTKLDVIFFHGKGEIWENLIELMANREVMMLAKVWRPGYSFVKEKLRVETRKLEALIDYQKKLRDNREAPNEQEDDDDDDVESSNESSPSEGEEDSASERGSDLEAEFMIEFMIDIEPGTA